MFPAARAADLGPEDKGTPVVVTGWLRDITCLARYKEVTRPLNDCPLMCARAGAPLVVVTTKGTIYLPISPGIPDSGERAKLMPHVAKYVRVSGRLFQRSGIRLIAVKNIEDLAGPQ